MKYLATLFFLLLASVANAQEYLPILKQGRVWKCVDTNVSLMGDVPRPFTVTVAGDTIVGNKKMFKVSVVYDKLDGYKDREDRVKPAYEENGQVWTLDYEGIGKATLLIDMNLHKGDKIEPGTVNDVDTIIVNGIKRKRLKVHDFDDGVYWVEGIGASHDIWAGSDGREIGAYAYMLECYDNGELVFTQADFRVKPTNAINNVKVGVKNNNDAMYDTNGRPVTCPVPGRIYIKGGLKYYNQN